MVRFGGFDWFSCGGFWLLLCCFTVALMWVWFDLVALVCGFGLGYDCASYFGLRFNDARLMIMAG